MENATERLSILVSPTEKKRIVRQAKEANLSVGAYLRQAARSYRPDADDPAVEALLRTLEAATAHTERTADDALTDIQASLKRVDRLLQTVPAKPATPEGPP